MASDADHVENLQQMISVQVEQLQQALIATREIATAQGGGVTVIYSRSAKPEMKVDMYVDLAVPVDQVRYVEE